MAPRGDRLAIIHLTPAEGLVTLPERTVDGLADDADRAHLARADSKSSPGPRPLSGPDAVEDARSPGIAAEQTPPSLPEDTWKAIPDMASMRLIM